MKKIAYILVFAFGIWGLFSCSGKKEEKIKMTYELKIVPNIGFFNEDSAFEFVKKQLAFGPRNPGSQGHKKTLEYLKKKLERYSDELILQSFDYTGYEGEILHLTNLIARFNPEKKKRIFIAAHWDTRPRADMEVLAERAEKPIPGANDGASGVAVLLELARIFKDYKPEIGVDLIFFDGEDYGKEEDLKNYCLGSKYFAANFKGRENYLFGIVLDMVGDKGSGFFPEYYSEVYASEINKMVWDAGFKLGLSRFRENTVKYQVYDDHVPLNQAGIKTIDIIDAGLIQNVKPLQRRTYWHTLRDDIRNISKDSLGQVGRLVAAIVYGLKIY
jgi:hypothetical protein